LEPVAERLLDRHLSMAKEWMPHEYIPWSLGRDFDTEPWTPDQPRLTGVAQAAFEVNLLTEDNLPSYHRELLATFGRDGAWSTWSHRWTAEEGRHAVVLRDYLLVTRNIDPVALERGRMATVQQGWMPDKSALGLMAYAAFQELATRISHRNTGRYSDDPVADKIMVRVAADENLHMMFYRDIVAAALHVDPSATVQAVTEEVIGFDMPGVGIAGFTRKALQMARAGIYDLRIHHDEILWPLLRHWDLFDLPGLRPEAEQARERLAAHLAKTDRLASRFEAKRAATATANEQGRLNTQHELGPSTGRWTQRVVVVAG
jgi:acyl-[acyl-carrier-protein] desaturase